MIWILVDVDVRYYNKCYMIELEAYYIEDQLL